MGEQGDAAQRKAGFVETGKGVSAAVVGVRGSRGHESEMSRLNPGGGVVRDRRQ